MNENHTLTARNILAELPVALQNDENMNALATAIAGALAARPAEIDLTRIYAQIDALPEEILDILAYDFKVDWWDADYNVEQKRQTLKDSWRVHRILGTKAAVETAISAIYPATQVKEWFEYGGEPYWFKLLIDLTGVVANPEAHERILNRVSYYKNLRSHIDEIEYIIRPDHDDTVHMGGCMAAIVCLPIMELADNIRFDDKARFGGVLTTDSCLPIPEVPDEIQLDGATRIGGRMVAHSSLPIPEIEDTPCFASSMHT
ncbi:MAG: phage tail protein I [Synergistaceae bacterium]|nr:phage tail protein I [Synergistaceae bacterium]